MQNVSRDCYVKWSDTFFFKVCGSHFLNLCTLNNYKPVQPILKNRKVIFLIQTSSLNPNNGYITCEKHFITNNFAGPIEGYGGGGLVITLQ